MIVYTSIRPKILVNTALWYPGKHWQSPPELSGYIWIKSNLPRNSKIFTFVDNKYVIGINMYSNYWDKKYQTLFNRADQLDISELYRRLRQEKFKYIVIDHRTLKKFGSKKTENLLKQLRANTGFKQVEYSNDYVEIFEINQNL